MAFDMLPSLFSTQEAFSMALDHAYRSIEEDEFKIDDMNLLCRCVAGKSSRKGMVYFVNFTEAVKIDSHFFANKRKLRDSKEEYPDFPLYAVRANGFRSR